MDSITHLLVAPKIVASLTALLPAILLPVHYPFGDPFLDVGGVGEQVHLRARLQGLERFDRRGEFHAVFRGLRLSTGNLLAVLPSQQYRFPAARTGVPAACSIAVYVPLCLDRA